MADSTSAVKFNELGLVPVVVQDADTNEVLMLAFMNGESLAKTIETGETWFWSRSRRHTAHQGSPTRTRLSHRRAKLLLHAA